MENACPHAGLPLSEGSLDGCVVTCTAHGWTFDVRTGFAPGENDGFPIPCFQVRVEDGHVHVDITEPTNLRRRRGGGD
jgi:3-phenylpropionate/trans-cinnamate dioxygenase ferredoxin subunit